MVYPEDTSETGADGTASRSDKSSMPKEDSNSSKAGPSGASSQDESPMVREVFSMFKNYLEVKLEEKGRQLETKSKLDKQVTQMKFKGNQKQFEHNAHAQIDSVFDRIRSANASESKDVDDLVNEGKELIRKRQKLIRIADKSVDGWKVVDEYISDELASGSEDEKRLKKAKEAASRKRKQATQAGRRGSDKKFKGSLASPDQQLFRGEITLFKYFCIHCPFCVVRFLLCFHVGGTLCILSFVRVRMRPTHTLFCLFLFADIKEVNNLRSFERSELERKYIFHWYLSFCLRCQFIVLPACYWLLLTI